MSLTKKQLEKRRNYLGSSDLPAILNLDPYRSSYDVWLEKTGQLTEQEETAVMARGNYLEPALLEYTQDVLGEPVINSPELRTDACSAILDHPDAILQFRRKPVEAKSVGNYAKEVWGDEETDQVPDRVVIQCQVHNLCSDQDLCYVPVYLPYREFCMFQVRRDQELIEMIIDAAERFWEINVIGGKKPDSKPHLAVVRRVRRYPETAIEIADNIVKRKLFVDSLFSRIKRLKEQADADLIASLDQAETGSFSEGIVTYHEYEKSAYEVKPSKFRRLYVKKGKLLC